MGPLIKHLAPLIKHLIPLSKHLTPLSKHGQVVKHAGKGAKPELGAEQPLGATEGSKSSFGYTGLTGET